ncbi:vegetative cell wall protein gp1-like [Simochromis diagramma]|uniref:vegetative cell wall protein gp1-like n=1 Tax=Simochromis diagramma TaxID=43689 RepID=UPI001A7E6718|nr:vegetative cell wall protein gp1-like [Simochromis diagramma]
MDPAALNPSKELWENLIDASQELIDLWLESPDDKSHRAIERRLQRLVTGLPWLLGSLYPWEQEFLLLDLGLHPPSAFTFEQPDAWTLPKWGSINLLLNQKTVSAAPAEPGLYCHSPAQFCVQPLAPQSVAQPLASAGAPLTVQPPFRSATQLPSPLASLQPIFLSMAQSAAQLMAESQSSLAPLQEAMPIHPLKDCFSAAVSEQGDKLFHNGPVPQKLATLETTTHSRASPEAGLQPSAYSGPLEAKMPARDCTRLSLPEQSQCSAQLQPSSCVPEAHVPTGFVSRSPEAHEPAGFVLCVPGAPMPTGFEPVFAGGTKEPVQPSPSSAASAEGSQEPLQPVAFAGGTEEPIQLSPSPAVPPPAAPSSPASTPPPAATFLSGPVSEPSASPDPASDSASPSPSPAPASASFTPGPASASASSTPGPASVSASLSGPASVSASSSSPAASAPASPFPASASAPAPPGSASAAASASSFSSSLPGSAAGMPPSGPRLAPPHHHWPFSRPLAGRHRRCGRPPERGRRRHCLPHGQPPELFARRHGLLRGQPPELSHPGLLCYWPPDRPPELCFGLPVPCVFC